MSLLKTVRVVSVLVLLLSSLVLAEVPSVLNYQGKLSDPLGDPIADGNYSITFSIWTGPAGGESKWSETLAGIHVADGVFSVLLGTTAPISDTVFEGPARFLEIEVNGETVVPRIQMTSVGYAHRIGTIDGASGGYITDSLVIVSSSEGLVLGSSREAAFAGKSRIELGISEAGLASVAMFEPVDSKVKYNAGEGKKIEIMQGGLVMFGDSDQDTTLIVKPNGDITSVGQITMGHNSSDGINTTVLGFENTADGDSSTIGGGSENVATGAISVIAGGHANTTLSEGATIGGGSFNEVGGKYATISGGTYNNAGGDYASIPGGNLNQADGLHSYSAGHRAKALHDGAFVWADQTETDFGSSGIDQFLIRAGGGVGINTNAPMGLLDVTGAEGDGSVNLPMSALAAPEILDEAGLASDRSATPFALTKLVTSMDRVLQVEITIPAPGYVVVRAGGTMEGSGTSKQNQALAQVSEAGTGTVEPAYTVRAGSGDHDTPSSAHYFGLSTERIFAKDSGTYVFYFEAMAHPDNGSSGVININNPYLTATYLPTAYGAVTAVVTAGESTDYEQKTYVGGSTTMDGGTGATADGYQVDLRELELRALKTRLEAERAERELLEARIRQ